MPSLVAVSWYTSCVAVTSGERDPDGRGGERLIEGCLAQAERLTDLVLEEVERLDASEHEEAYVLALVARDLARRVAELGEFIEAEAHDLNDRSALQMATALQAQCASLQAILDMIVADPRFGLIPSAVPRRPGNASAGAEPISLPGRAKGSLEGATRRLDRHS
jgi:hypothetical protein